MDRAFLQDRRVWIAGGVFAALIVVAAGWFMLISPKLDSADSLSQQNGDAQTANAMVAAKNNKLAKQSRNIGSLKANLANAVAGLPAGTGLADFTREVTSAAQVRRVTITTIAIAPPTAPAAAAAPVATTPDSGSTPTPSTPSPSATASAAAGGAGSAMTISVTLTTTGSLAAQTAFLHDLQNGSRRLLVGSSQLSVASGSRVNSVDTSTTMTTQLTVFTAPSTAQQLQGLQVALNRK